MAVKFCLDKRPANKKGEVAVRVSISTIGYTVSPEALHKPVSQLLETDKTIYLLREDDVLFRDPNHLPGCQREQAEVLTRGGVRYTVELEIEAR